MTIVFDNRPLRRYYYRRCKGAAALMRRRPPAVASQPGRGLGAETGRDKVAGPEGPERPRASASRPQAVTAWSTVLRKYTTDRPVTQPLQYLLVQSALVRNTDEADTGSRPSIGFVLSCHIISAIPPGSAYHFDPPAGGASSSPRRRLSRVSTLTLVRAAKPDSPRGDRCLQGRSSPTSDADAGGACLSVVLYCPPVLGRWPSHHVAR
jgi:hypothetical protein